MYANCCLDLCDRRRSRPDVACEVWSVGRCCVLHVKLQLLETSDLNADTKPAWSAVNVMCLCPERFSQICGMFTWSYFYVLLTVHPCIILEIQPTWCTIFLSMFISFLYMFRATVCPSSPETCREKKHTKKNCAPIWLYLQDYFVLSACPSAWNNSAPTGLIFTKFYTFWMLFQNNCQQDDTYGISFISGLVVLHSTCFELRGAHHQKFTFLLYRQPLAYCVIFCCIPPVLLCVL